jgi:1,4-alpha-glucan branching enzyme
MAKTTTRKTVSSNAKKKENFTFFAPTAENVELVGDFTGWEDNPITLKRSKDGTWKATVPLEPGTHEYRFKVDGQWKDDETCMIRRPNAFGEQNCVREVSA